MKKIVLLLILVCTFMAIYAFKYSTNNATKTTNKKGFVVVELFTSQGCSSCPPADDILRGLSNMENVYPLSFHVTYWNRLGWKDEYSQSIFDERQYAYGSKFVLNSVYTPQTIINGKVQMVGSHKKEIEKNLELQLKNESDYTIELSKSIKDKALIINYKLSKSAQNKVLNFALTESNISTQVKRGENEGRTLKHNNVVKIFKTKSFKNVSDTEGVMAFDIENININDIIVFLQEENYGAIIGATKLKIY